MNPRVLVSIAVLQAAAIAGEPPANDLCENAQLLEFGVPVQGTTRGATWDHSPPREYSFSDSWPGVWYRFIGNGSLLTVDISGASGSNSKTVFCGGCSHLGPIWKPCTAEESEYLVLILGSDVDFTITLLSGEPCDDFGQCDLPINDDCEAAIPVEIGEITTTRVLGARASRPIIEEFAYVGSKWWQGPMFASMHLPSVWYRVVGDGTILTLYCSVPHHLFYVNVYCGGCDHPAWIGHEFQGDAFGILNTSWCSSPDQEYFIQIAGWPLNPEPTLIDFSIGAGTGACDLAQSCLARPPLPVPENESWWKAPEISGVGQFEFSNVGAHPKRDPGLCSWRTVWFCWTAESEGMYSIDTCTQARHATALDVFPGCPLTAGHLACEEGLFSSVNRCEYQTFTEPFAALGGERFSIGVGSWSGLGIHPPLSGGSGTFRITKGVPPLATCNLTTPGNERCTPSGRWEAYESTRGVVEVADDFILLDGWVGSTGDTDSLCWQGTYFNGSEECSRSIPDEFEVTYYADNCGVPGDVVAGPFSQADGSLTVHGPAMTGGRLMDTLREYQYSARHAQVSLPANQTYWLKITNSADSDCRWYWEAGASRNVTSVVQQSESIPAVPDWARAHSLQDGQTGTLDGFDPTDYRPQDMAFCLSPRRSFERTTCQSVPLTERCAHLGETMCPSENRYPPPPNDHCANAAWLDASGAWVDTLGATTDGLAVQPPPTQVPDTGCDFQLGDRQIHQDVWYDYGSQCTGPTRLSLCGGGFDSKIAVYSSLICPAANHPFACSDDACGSEMEPEASVTFNALRDRTYRVRVGGYRWDAGVARLSVSHEPIGSADLRDFATLAACFAGTCAEPPCDSSPPSAPCCGGVDFDENGTVDLSDHAQLIGLLIE